MSKIYGILSFSELTKLAHNNAINTIILAFTDPYGRFMGKRLDIDFFLETSAQHEIAACNYLLSTDMDMYPQAGFEFSNWEKGYGDFHLIPDMQTLRSASWLNKTALVICDVTQDNLPVTQAPRSLLKKQIDRMQKHHFTAYAASELEYYIFKDSYQEAANKHYSNLNQASRYIEDYHILQGTREEIINAPARFHLKHSGIPVESSKGEWGKGQHEMNIRYAEALAMADRHCILKQCIKEIAEKIDYSITFMAKPFSDQAGSSCHIHISLWQKNKNSFAGKHAFNGGHSSDYFRWFLAGWMHHMPELMVFYASTVNAYKRFQSESWAPTKLAWSFDNRTAGFRIVGKDQSLRIECRIPGADCNPYLAYAAALASGLDGILNKMEPPPIYKGNIYSAKNIPSIPMNLREAIQLFQKSHFARQTFGDDVVDHYMHFFELEQNAYDKAVTDWERQRYFEQI